MAFGRKKKKNVSSEEAMYMETQWQLIVRKFKKHKLAMVGLITLAILYTLGIFSEFFATQDIAKRSTSAISMAPTAIHFVDEDGNFSLQPFVYGKKQEEDPETWKKYYVDDTSVKHKLRFFYHGDSYKLLGFIPGDIHFFGTPEPDVLNRVYRVDEGQIGIVRYNAAYDCALKRGLGSSFIAEEYGSARSGRNQEFIDGLVKAADRILRDVCKIDKTGHVW